MRAATKSYADRPPRAWTASIDVAGRLGVETSVQGNASVGARAKIGEPQIGVPLVARLDACRDPDRPKANSVAGRRKVRLAIGRSVGLEPPEQISPIDLNDALRLDQGSGRIGRHRNPIGETPLGAEQLNVVTTRLATPVSEITDDTRVPGAQTLSTQSSVTPEAQAPLGFWSHRAALRSPTRERRVSPTRIGPRARTSKSIFRRSSQPHTSSGSMRAGN